MKTNLQWNRVKIKTRMGRPKTIFSKIVNVKAWDSRDLNYMGKIEVSSKKLGEFVGDKVKIIVTEI